MVLRLLRKMFSNAQDEKRFEIDETRIKDKSNIYIAGATKRNDKNIEIQDILSTYMHLANHEIDLVREPDNKYDKHAIKVYLKQQHIGYVPASHSRKIASFIDKGYEVKGYLEKIRAYENDSNQIKLGCDLTIYTLNEQPEN